MSRSVAYAALSASGTWAAQTIKSDTEVTINGDVYLNGPIVIANGATLTINRVAYDASANNNNGNGNLHIRPASGYSNNPNYPTCLFYVEQGGKLIITGINTSVYISLNGNSIGKTFVSPVDETTTKCVVGTQTYKDSYNNVTNYLRDGTYLNFINGGLICAVGSLDIKYARLYGMAAVAPADQDIASYAGAIYRPDQTDQTSYTYGPINIEHSQLSFNRSSAGSAIWIGKQVNSNGLNGNTPTSCAITLKSVQIYSNITASSSDAGAIRANASVVGNLTMQNCSMYRNFTNGNGADIVWAARAHKDTKLTISESDFYNNYSNGSAAALLIEGNFGFSSGSTLTKIRNNTADADGNNKGDGGGIYVRTHGITKSSSVSAISMSLDENVEIQYNNAYNGGGVVVDFTKESNFTNNSEVNVLLSGPTIKFNSASANGGGVYLVNNNTTLRTNVKLSAGSIQNNTAGVSGGGIYCKKGAELADPTKNVIKFNGGTISNNTATSGSGGGIYIEGLNVVSDDDVTGISVFANTSSINGGGICVVGSNADPIAFTVSNGVIGGGNENQKNQSTTGAGLYIKNGNLTVNGGYIEGNVSSSHGAGIAAYKSTVLVAGGTIRNNNSGYANGGGVYLEDCTSKFVGGKITGNLTQRGQDDTGVEMNNTGFGGGVYIKKSASGSSSFILEGSTISGNSACSGGGVLLNGGDFDMTGGVIEDNQGVWHGGGVCVVNATSFNITSGKISNNYTTAKNGGGIYFEVPGVTMNINGGEISGNKALGNIAGGIYVRAGSLTITKGTVSNNRSANNGGGVNFNSTGGLLKINGGSVSGNTVTDGSGGGIYVANGSFVIEEGNVSNNSTLKDGTSGGGIYFSSGDAGTMSVKGGFISGNTSDQLGGGIYVRKGNLDIVGGEIHSNHAGFGGGGLVYYAESSVTIDGGKIYENSTGSYGGGVYLVQGNMLLRNGQIYSNTVTANEATKGGGGIYVHHNATELTLSGGKVYDNEAAAGAGIYVNGHVDSTQTQFGATMTINDCDIYNNTARYRGGGIFLKTLKKVTIKNGLIRNNTAQRRDDLFQAITSTEKGYGGGIFVESECAGLTIEGGKVTENTGYFGAGMYIKGGPSVINGGIISKNVSTHNGGAIYIVSGQQLDIRDGVIEGNTAVNMGGGLVVDSSTGVTVNISGGAITSNQAPLGGGMVIAKQNSVVNMSGGEISNNIARVGGGVYLVDKATLNFGNGLIVNNKAIRMDNTATLATTGYNAENVADKKFQGVGGGVCVSGAKLLFDGTSVGLYGNNADLLGDDIFSTGKTGSQVTIPCVSNMKLAGYDAATTELNWMEDYANGDTGYEYGTKVNATTGYIPIRYREALRDRKNVYSVNIPQQGATTYTKYVALALGYNLMQLIIERKGLMKGENAIYKISNKNKQGQWETYAQVLVSGSSQATTPELAVQYPATKTISVYAGEWKVEEIGWDWAYEGTSMIERELSSTTSNADWYFTFSANKVTDVTESQHSESVVINDFGRGTVVTQ